MEPSFSLQLRASVCRPAFRSWRKDGAAGHPNWQKWQSSQLVCRTFSIMITVWSLENWFKKWWIWHFSFRPSWFEKSDISIQHQTSGILCIRPIWNWIHFHITSPWKNRRECFFLLSAFEEIWHPWKFWIASHWKARFLRIFARKDFHSSSRDKNLWARFLLLQEAAACWGSCRITAQRDRIRCFFWFCNCLHVHSASRYKDLWGCFLSVQESEGHWNWWKNRHEDNRTKKILWLRKCYCISSNEIQG